MLGAGELNKRITLRRETYNEPTGGKLSKQSPTWIDMATVWANIKTNSASESVVAAQVQAVGKYTITIRYRRGLDEVDQVVYRGRQLQINGIINVDEENKWLILDCSEWKGQS